MVSMLIRVKFKNKSYHVIIVCIQIAVWQPGNVIGHPEKCVYNVNTEMDEVCKLYILHPFLRSGASYRLISATRGNACMVSFF